MTNLLQDSLFGWIALFISIIMLLWAIANLVKNKGNYLINLAGFALLYIFHKIFRPYFSEYWHMIAISLGILIMSFAMKWLAEKFPTPDDQDG